MFFKRSSSVTPAREEVSVTPKRPELFPRSCRAFVRLLNFIGLSAGPGWCSFVAAIIFFTIHSIFSYYFVLLGIVKFRQLRDDGQAFFRAVFDSGFVGILRAGSYIALVLTFTFGRRRCARLLPLVRSVLEDLKQLPGVTRTGWKPNRTGEYIWVLTVALTICYYATKIQSGLYLCGEMSSSLNTTTSCAEWIGGTIASGIVNISFMLIAIKFVFVGHLLAYGFQTVNIELEAIAAKHSPSHSADLRQIGLFQRRLSELMSQLCSDMAPELIAVMAVGVLAEIALVIVLVFTPLGAGWLLRLLRHLPMTAVSLVGPCETCQRVLTQLDVSRDLLLQLQWRRPQLEVEAEVGLLLKTVERDLEKVGDVGLYRLRRPTLLSIFSTVMTYIIVMAQFQMSEAVTSGDN